MGVTEGYIIDEQLAELLVELTKDNEERINPVQDRYGRYFVSIQEYNNPAFRHILNVLDDETPVNFQAPARKVPGT